MLAHVPRVVEAHRLQVGLCDCDFRQARLGRNFLPRVCNQAACEKLMFLSSPEAAHEMPCDLGVDDGFAAAAAVIDRHDKILHALRSDPIGLNLRFPSFPKIRNWSGIEFWKTELAGRAAGSFLRKDTAGESDVLRLAGLMGGRATARSGPSVGHADFADRYPHLGIMLEP